MFDFYQKRKLRTVIQSPFTKGILFLLVLLMSWSAFTRYQMASEMKERRLEAESSLEELRAQKAQLEEKVNYLSDERGIEAEMRRQFDVALPNEQVVVIVDPEQAGDESTSTATQHTTEDETPWYAFWR